MTFEEKARLIHGSKYTYDINTYVNNKVKMLIFCPEHGEFWQRPDNHLSGKGCMKCARKIIDKVQVKKIEDFIEESKLKHCGKYDYSKVKYVNAHTKVCIICQEHGEFWQEPQHHRNGAGCKKCGGALVWRKDEFIERANIIHNSKYDYSKVEYVKSITKVCIICPEHGEFWQSPNAHFVNGCPSCSIYGFKPDKRGFVYVLINDETQFIKIGISNDPERRISQLRRNTPFNFSVISIYEHPNAPKEEKRLHKLNPSAGLKGFDGATEWRKIAES